MSSPCGRLVLGATWIAAAAQAGWAYSRWPERVPLHFGPGGVVDRWGTGTEFFLVWGIVLGVLALIFGGIPRLLARMPVSAINLPNREYWLADERRAATMARMGGQMAWFGVATLALMAVLLQLMDGVAMSGEDRMSAAALWTVFGVYGAFVLAFVVRMLVSYRLPASN